MTLNITLDSDVTDLDEFIVIGYGTQKKEDLTGAVAVVDMGEANKVTTASVAEKLQGQVAGVSIQASGDPGSMGKVRIRGVGSFSDVGPVITSYSIHYTKLYDLMILQKVEYLIDTKINSIIK